MLGSFQKREHGIVTWNGERCIGCRYCAVACPYNIPKFEWEKAFPLVVTGELCNHRIAEGGIPACCEVCPRHAVMYGRYRELLAEAKRRLAEQPNRYYPKIFGERDAGVGRYSTSPLRKCPSRSWACRNWGKSRYQSWCVQFNTASTRGSLRRWCCMWYWVRSCCATARRGAAMVERALPGGGPILTPGSVG